MVGCPLTSQDVIRGGFSSLGVSAVSREEWGTTLDFQVDAPNILSVYHGVVR